MAAPCAREGRSLILFETTAWDTLEADTVVWIAVVTEERTYASYNRLRAVFLGILVTGIGVVTTGLSIAAVLTAGGTAQGAF